MTREEITNEIKCLLSELNNGENAVSYLTRNDVKWLNENIKALEQEPKKGHWIMTRDYITTAYSSIEYVKCSCCGEDSLEYGNYCPNCGAEMNEVEE